MGGLHHHHHHHHHHHLHMIFIIIFFAVSFYFTHILFPNASLFNAPQLPHQYSNNNFRFLLGVKSFSNNAKSRNGGEYSTSLPPSPSPSPAAAAHRQAHPPPHHPHTVLPQPHKIVTRKKDEGRVTTRVLTAVLASVGITSALCAVGLFFGCRKLKKQKRRQRRTGVSVFRSKFVSNSQSSVKKVSSDPGPDLFYLNSLESALEPDRCCLKLEKTSVCALVDDEREASNKKLIKSGCSSFGEITTVNEVHSSDDADEESFHSFCDSPCSSQLRLSNASACAETSENPKFPLSDPILSASTTISQPPPPPPACSPVTGVPPPPCPPPLPKGKAPPPPPSQLTQQIPLGKDGSPLPKLKPLHWDKVRAAPNRSTVWDKLRSSSFEFDEEMIESLFGYNLQNNPMKNDETKSKTPSPSKHVLEPKRLHNITILARALNVTAEQVCVALVRGDGLLLQDLEALSKMVPTKEEEAKLSNYKGDVFELGSAEKLVKAMLKIPFAFSRIEAMLYRETFEDEVLHLGKSFSILEEACKELRSSRLFLKLLEAVLKTGNRMNIGTIRGGAKAFKLDALLKLADVKGTDGKTTLLHFVVQEIVRSEGLRVSESIMGKIHQISNKNINIEDKEEYYKKMGLDLISGLTTELCNAKKTATIDLDVLASSVTNLSDNMRKMQNLIEKEMIMEENKGGFVSSMRSFLKYAEIKLKELREDENRVLLHVREITEYFHGDVSKDESNPLRIFVIVRDFLSMLDNVCKELRSLKAPRSHNPLAPFR